MLPANKEFIRNRSSNLSYKAVLEAKRESCLEYIDEQWVLRVDGKPLALHSKRYPQQEASRQIEHWFEEESPNLNEMVVVIGAGGLYHLIELAPHLGEDAALILVEPNPDDLRRLAEVRDLSAELVAKCPIRIVASDDIDQIGREVRQLLSLRRRFVFSLFIQPTLSRIHHDLYQRVCDKLAAEIRTDGTSRATLAAFSDEWQQHAIVNLPTVTSNPGVAALKDKFKGDVAVVVAAGPSLNTSIEHIRNLQDHAIVISVGTALKPLMAAGITPHLVVVIDSDPVTWKQFNDCQPDGVYMVSAVSLFPALIDMFRDRLFSFSTTLRDFSQWLSTFGASPGQLSLGGTVSVSAVDLALHLGCKELLIFGLDLAFLDDGTTHANHSMYDGRRLAPKQLVQVPGNFDGDVYTTKQFANYVELFGDYLDEVKGRETLKLFNINNGGAKIRGMEVIHSEQFDPAPFARVKADRRAKVADIHVRADRPATTAVNRAIARVNRQLGRVQRTARQGRAITRQLQAGDPNEPRLLKRLERCDRALKKNSEAMLLLTGAMAAFTMQIVDESEGADSRADALERSQRLYAHLQGATAWLAGLFELAAKMAQNNDAMDQERALAQQQADAARSPTLAAAAS